MIWDEFKVKILGLWRNLKLVQLWMHSLKGKACPFITSQRLGIFWSRIFITLTFWWDICELFFNINGNLVKVQLHKNENDSSENISTHFSPLVAQVCRSRCMTKGQVCVKFDYAPVWSHSDHICAFMADRSSLLYVVCFIMVSKSLWSWKIGI